MRFFVKSPKVGSAVIATAA